MNKYIHIYMCIYNVNMMAKELTKNNMNYKFLGVRIHVNNSLPKI